VKNTFSLPIFYLSPLHQRRKYTEYFSVSCCLLIAGVRQRWNEEQKKLVLASFSNIIKKKIGPKKDEIMKFIDKFDQDGFSANDYQRIRTLIINETRIRNQKK